MKHKRFKPQNDFIFKRLFGEAETKELLIDLPNRIIWRSLTGLFFNEWGVCFASKAAFGIKLHSHFLRRRDVH